MQRTPIIWLIFQLLFLFFNVLSALTIAPNCCISERPWLCDNYEEWHQRLQDKPHKCAVIFVDNSGADIILGVFPFVRGLLRRGTKVCIESCHPKLSRT